jgi:hypothetical protein
MPRLQFSVKSTDEESLARSGVLKIGSDASITTPFRWAASPTGVEDAALGSALPGTENPLRTARLVSRKLVYATVKNIEESNGKSQTLTRLVTNSFGPQDEATKLRALHLRWNKSSKWRATEISHRTMSEREARAMFAFGLPFRLDIHIPAIPSMVDRFDVFKRVVDAYFSEAETFNNKAPVMGYIPNVESLSLAGRMADYYDKLGCEFYGIDLAGGHPFALISTVVRRLRDNRKNNYYLHGFNVRQTRPSEADIVPIEDLLKISYGFDSISRVAFGGGGNSSDDEDGEAPAPTDAELIAKLRYTHFGDYGAYRPAALKRAKGAVSCSCRVCKPGGGPNGILSGPFPEVRARVKTHALLTEADEYVRIRKGLGEGKFRSDLGKKSQAAAPLKTIDNEITRIRSPSL